MSPELRRTLRALLDVLIPDAEDMSIPGAVSAGVPDRSDLFDEQSGIGEILIELDKRALDFAGRQFADLTFDEAEQFLKGAPDIWLDCTRRVGPLALRAYFEDPSVREALGLPERPPFPDGFAMEAIDYDLLEPVVERGQKYRDPGWEEI